MITVYSGPAAGAPKGQVSSDSGVPNVFELGQCRERFGLGCLNSMRERVYKIMACRDVSTKIGHFAIKWTAKVFV